MSETLPAVPAAPGVPAKWADKFTKIAESQRKSEKTSGMFFSIKAGQLTFAGNPIAGNKMDTVVLESMHERVYYPEKYGSGENTSPTCYSYSATGEDMAPHPESLKPQHPTCKGCPHDKWGSSDNGKGKACKEGRRLSVMSAGDLTDAGKVGDAVVGYLRLPVTSVRNFSSYVQGVVGGSSLPLFCFVTRIAVLPDPKTQVKVTFERVSGIDNDEVMEAVFNRATAEAENIQFPYPRPNADGEPAKPAKKSGKF
jgi:hypothetical protein